MIMNEEQKAKILLNNEIQVTDWRSQFVGQTGIVKGIMADGRTLDIRLSNGCLVFLDSWSGKPISVIGPINNDIPVLDKSFYNENKKY